MNSKSIGVVSEAAAIFSLTASGRHVLIPFGNNQRYDLAYEDNGRFVRAQVKTCRLKNGSIIFKTSSVNPLTGARRQYVDEADVFVVHCPETGGTYLVPVEECGASAHSLRVGPYRGGPKTTSRYAKEYEIITQQSAVVQPGTTLDS